MIILDLQFIVDLLSSGIYWTIFDSLAESLRDTFREMWGRLFELYVVELLQEHYPTVSGILLSDLNFADGQIDALLDFGEFVIVIEAKASLCNGVREAERRFVTILSGFSPKVCAKRERQTESCAAIDHVLQSN